MSQRVSIDTRTIQPGDIFIPVGDGHRYCDEARNKGATVLDVDLTEYAIEKRNAYTGTVIGVTGSFGKTTLKDTLLAALSPFGVSGTEKNFNNELGVPLTIANCDPNHPYWVIEMGIRKPGDMAHLSSTVQPDIAILSGFGYTHMEFYNQEVDLLLEKLAIITDQTSQLLIPSSIHLKPQIYKHADCPIIDVTVDRLIDTNTCLTHALCTYLKLDQQKVTTALNAIKQSPHRLSQTPLPNGTILIDDSYNSNPIAVQFAVEYCQTHYPNQETLVVLGDMEELGQASETHHANTLSFVSTTASMDVITYGKRFTTSSKNLTTHSDLIDCLSQEINNYAVILIKGSRSNQLDVVINKLIDLFTK